MQFSDVPTAGEVALRSMVPILLDDRPVGTGVLITTHGRIRILTAAHILFDEETGRFFGGRVSFCIPVGSPATQLTIPPTAISKADGTDAAVLDLESMERFVQPDVQRHFQFAPLSEREMIVIHPSDEQMRSVMVHISGFPSQRSDVAGPANYLRPFTYSSGSPHGELLNLVRSAHPDSHVVSVPPDSNREIETLEPTDRPLLSGMSGGPWFVVDKETARPRLVAIHSGRKPYGMPDGTVQEVALGIPLFTYEAHLRIYRKRTE